MSNDKFTHTLSARMNDYGVNLSAQTIRELSEYYTLLMRWNERLHLVAPCDAEEFAWRHVLESLLLLRFLPTNAAIVDVGSGAGLPIIPCLIARSDLSATLIGSSQKKTVFLREAANRASIANRVAIVAKPLSKLRRRMSASSRAERSMNSYRSFQICSSGHLPGPLFSCSVERRYDKS
jgi:16S rRNA (guanine527-N7)-methyltransferase